MSTSAAGPIGLPQDPVPVRVGAVHVLVPTRVFNDLESMKRVTADILNRLGHPGCHSGFDIRFIREENFRVDEKLHVTPLAASF